MADVLVDDRLHAQALGVLEREQPGERAEWLFKLHDRLVLGFFNVTLLYLALSFLNWGFLEPASSLSRTLTLVVIRPLALLVVVLLVLTIIASALNFGLLLRLLRLARLQRRLRQPWRNRTRSHLRATRRPLAVVKQLFLAGLGTLLIAFGLLGIIVESWAAPILLFREADPAKLQLAIATTLCGFSSVLLIYLDAGRRRLRTISELRASLLGHQGAIPARVYDGIAATDRVQVEADRQSSIKAESRSQERRYSYRESHAFVDAKQALPADVVLDVLNATASILDHPRVPPTSSDTHICFEHIDGTDLELGYLVDPRSRVITFFALCPVGSERPSIDDAAAIDTASYRIDLARAARAAYDALTADARASVDALLSNLARDPDEQRHLASVRPTGELLRRLQSPPLEVTYSVDRAAMTLVVLHVAPIMPARRQLFVSYSHADRDAFVRVMRFVRLLEDRGLADIWSDDHSIEPGTRWDDEIGRALDRAHAALLLVSPAFVRSEFIRTRELPHLLRRANEDFRLYWMHVRPVADADAVKEIAAYQSLLVPPELSLEELALEPARCEAELFEVYRKLAVGFSH